MNSRSFFHSADYLIFHLLFSLTLLFFFIRYLLLKDPKFIVYKKDKQQTAGNQPQSNVKQKSTLTGGSAQVPGITPAPAVASPVVAKKPWLVTPLKDKNGIVAIGRMPPEAGGGGLTAASQVKTGLFPLRCIGTPDYLSDIYTKENN